MRFGAASLVALAAACAACAGPKDPPPAPVGGSADGVPLAGGWSDCAVTDPDVVASAERAVGLLRAAKGDPGARLAGVVAARRQVVAGTNWGFRLRLATAGGERTVAVTMWSRLDGGAELTEIRGWD